LCSYQQLLSLVAAHHLPLLLFMVFVTIVLLASKNSLGILVPPMLGSLASIIFIMTTPYGEILLEAELSLSGFVEFIVLLVMASVVLIRSFTAASTFAEIKGLRRALGMLFMNLILIQISLIFVLHPWPFFHYLFLVNNCWWLRRLQKTPLQSHRCYHRHYRH